MKILYLFVWVLSVTRLFGQETDFRVLAFYTAKNDQAHISFVQEANVWFSQMGIQHHFEYRSTADWNQMQEDTLERYDVILFLDSRPEDLVQRAAFQGYMDAGGAWIGFHFAAFALTPSDFPQDWEWYHRTFLGCGQYKSNTWRPTSAVLRNENHKHPVTKGIKKTFHSAPNEWYRWEEDLRKNPDIEVLVSIDPESFPLGTGPKLHEIWHSGDYPVVWTNRNFRMVYFNMGHNDIDYEGHTNQTLSSTFSSKQQNRMFLNAVMWLGMKRNVK